MSKRVLTDEAEILEPLDLNNMSLYPQQALDKIVGDAVAYPAHWAGVTVSIKSAQEVTVSTGRYFDGDTVYEAEAPIDVNLQTYLPLVASDERWLALILRGSVVQLPDQRTFETSEDPELSVPVSRSTPVAEARQFAVIVQQGNATPAPALKPVVAETDCAVAMVRVTASGVQEIVPQESARVKSLYEHEGRIVALEVKVGTLFQIADTLSTDLAALADFVHSMPVPRPVIITQMRRDIAALRRAANVPEGARADWFDWCLLYDNWDTENAAWLARVDEGIQFPYASQREARLELINEDDPLIKFSGRRMMPTWDEVVRISNEGTGATRDISQLVHTVTTLVKRTVSRSVTSYGATVNVCENAAGWGVLSGKEAGATFTKGGETLQVVANLGTTPGAPTDQNHQYFAVRTVKKKRVTRTYWDEVTEEIGVNGSIYGQTFLVSQATIATAIELQFTKIANDGDVHLFVCETDATGAPLYDKVLANVTRTAADLGAGGTGRKKFVIDPTYLTPGSRYAWYVVTDGNHQLQGTTGNKFSGGTSFLATDGAWAQGDTQFDFVFWVYAAQFQNVRTVVEFQPMTLENGMTEFRLLYAGWQPDGTALEWEYRPVFGGSDLPWYKIEAIDDGDPLSSPLAGLPSLVQLRCTMLATPDLAPMIELDEVATYRTARVGNTMRAISEPIDLGLTTDTIQTLTYYDDYDDALHTLSPRIMVGDGPALVTPDVTTLTYDDDPNRPGHVAAMSTYTVPAGTQIVRACPGFTTSNIVVVPFVENITLFAL